MVREYPGFEQENIHAAGNIQAAALQLGEYERAVAILEEVGESVDHTERTAQHANELLEYLKGYSMPESN